MRSSTAIAVAAAVVAPALVSALPTPQDGLSYARQVPQYQRPTPAPPSAAHQDAHYAPQGTRQKDHGHHHEHYHKHAHDHDHDHKYKSADHDYQPQHAVNAAPAAGHVAREAESGAINWGGIWDAAKDVYTVGKDGYDAYEAGKDAYDSIKGKSRRSAPAFFGGKAAQHSGPDGKPPSPFKEQTGQFGGQRGHSPHPRERFLMGNVALPEMERLEQNKIATRELMDILAREEAGSGAIDLTPTTGGITGVWRSIATRELADILARENESGAINWGGIWNAAKDAYTVGKDGYDAYEAGKDAYNSIKSSRSLLDELD